MSRIQGVGLQHDPLIVDTSRRFAFQEILN